MNLASVLYHYRISRRMGGREMARVLCLSQATYNCIERGNSMDAKSMMKVISWLFGEPVVLPPKPRKGQKCHACGKSALAINSKCEYPGNHHYANSQ